MKKLVTVFTPTYNRANLLDRCYDCLCKQTSMNFMWIIIDDGSTDNTKEIVDEWIRNEKRFEIKYIHKENGGLYTTYNEVIPVIDTELCICYESDDFFPYDSIEIIESHLEEIRKPEYVGLMTMCKDTNGNFLGNKFPENVKSMHLYDRFLKYSCTGDKMYVYKTEVLQKCEPMPIFDGEKNYNPLYFMYEADEFGELLVSNEVLCIVDYQTDGMTANVIRHYYDSPNSFAHMRKIAMQFPGASFGYIFKINIHYVSSCCLAKKLRRAVKESPKKAYTVFAFLPGLLLAGYVKFKNRDKKK